jgi:hypothetical protein
MSKGMSVEQLKQGKMDMDRERERVKGREGK